MLRINQGSDSDYTPVAQHLNAQFMFCVRIIILFSCLGFWWTPGQVAAQSMEKTLEGEWYVAVHHDTVNLLGSHHLIRLQRGSPTTHGCFFVIRLTSENGLLHMSACGNCQDDRCGWSFTHREKYSLRVRKRTLVGILTRYNQQWQPMEPEAVRFGYRLRQNRLELIRK